MISYNMNPLRLTVLKRKALQCPWKNIPSRDTRGLGAVTPPSKAYTSTHHTVAPAYNKGAYQVISKNNIKDIGK